MTIKDIYTLLYNNLTDCIDDNKLSHRIANTLKHKVFKSMQGYIKTMKDDITRTAATQARKGHVKMTREELVLDAQFNYSIAEGKDKLYWMQELNKLEDNYKGKTDTEVNIYIISYKDAVIADSVKPSTATQLRTIPPQDTNEAKL